MTANVLLSILFFLSLILNIYFFIRLKKLPKVHRKESLELQEFLADLMSGGAMLAVRRVDPEQILLRSPKNT